MSRPSLRELAREVAAELDAEDPAESRALEIARQLSQERPDTTAKGRQAAAYRAVGLDPGEFAGDPEPERRRRRRGGRRRLRAPRPSLRRGVTVPALVAQIMGLIALYWLLQAPDAIATVGRGVRGAISWLTNPYRGIGAPPPPAG